MAGDGQIEEDYTVKLDDEQAENLIEDPNITLSLKSNLNIIRCLQSSITDYRIRCFKANAN